MWQAPNQRVRAAATAKKREREKLRKSIHIKRIMATLEIQAQQNSLVAPEQETKATLALPKTEVRLILNDLSSKGVGFFSTEPLFPGQIVKMNISEPFQISFTAKIMWCQEYSMNSHVISSQPYSYRLGAVFELKSQEEVQSIKAFYEEVCKTYLYYNLMA